MRSQYTENENTELDALKELDAKVKKPANIFAFSYPVYNITLKKERQRIAPEILRLTDELLK